jgi:uncharacterized protein YndB with AHSA1/START domain
MATIHQQVLINAPVAKIYQAIFTADGIGTWWDKQTSTETNRGPVLEHNPGPEHGVVKLRVVELVPSKRIEWECISTHPKTSPASAWTGTHFVFEIVEGDNVASSGSKHNQDRATTLDVPKPVMMTRVKFLDLTTSHGGRYCKT